MFVGCGVVCWVGCWGVVSCGIFLTFSLGVWYTINMHKMTRDEVVSVILEVWGEVNDRNNEVLDRLERQPSYADEQAYLEGSGASDVLHRLVMEIRKREGA